MPLAGYPSLLAGFGPPFLNVSPQVTTGKMFFVSSVVGKANNVGDDPLRPLATLTQALAKARANKGDYIILMPSHAETVTAIGGITVSTAGVTVIGMGVGAQRPTFTFSTVAGASLLVNAVDFKMYNVVGVCGVALLTQPFDIEASGCYLDVEWQDPSSALQSVSPFGIALTSAVSNVYLRARILGQTSGGTAPVQGVVIGGTAVTLTTGVIDLDFYGRASTAVVNFVSQAAIDIRVIGTIYNSGVTDGSKNVVDTVTGSTWFASVNDAAAGQVWSGGSGAAAGLGSTSLLVPTANSTADLLERDVIGNKTDTTVDVVGTTKSLLAYAKGSIANLSGAAGVATYPTAAAYTNGVSIAAVLGYVQDGVRRGSGTIMPANTSVWDVLGSGTGTFTFPAAATPANNVSIAQVVRELFNQTDQAVNTTAGGVAISLATVSIFTIAGGPIEVLGLYWIWQTAAQAVATTLQFNVNATSGGATTVSGASASQSGVAAGTSGMCVGTFVTAPTITTGGTVATGTVKFMVPAGSIQYIAGTSANTGLVTWYLRYRPLARGVTVVAAI